MVVDNLPLVQTPPRKNRAPVRPYAVSMLASALAIVANPALAQDVEPTGDDPSEVPVPVPPADADLPELDPVITDEEFADTIPELKPSSDPELAAPLESIEEFERRIAAEQADGNPAAGQAPPLNDPALADGDMVEEIGDAPVRDAELVAPLPPLEQFEVEPVEFAQDESDEEVVEIAYSVQVNGT